MREEGKALSDDGAKLWDKTFYNFFVFITYKISVSFIYETLI